LVITNNDDSYFVHAQSVVAMGVSIRIGDNANCKVASNDLTQYVTGVDENMRERVTFTESTLNDVKQVLMEVGVSPFTIIKCIVCIIKV
jgi:hypothetical protein